MMALASLATCLQLLDEGLAADDAAHAVLVQRRVAFHRQDVVALVLGHDLFEDRLGLVAGGGHQRVVVVERDHRQHHVLGQRVRRADEATRSSRCTPGRAATAPACAAWSPSRARSAARTPGRGRARWRSASSTSGSCGARCPGAASPRRRSPSSSSPLVVGDGNEDARGVPGLTWLRVNTGGRAQVLVLLALAPALDAAARPATRGGDGARAGSKPAMLLARHAAGPGASRSAGNAPRCRRGDEADRQPARAGAAGAADAVHVVDRRARQVVVHHHRQLRDVDAARGQVGGDQHLQRALP